MDFFAGTQNQQRVLGDASDSIVEAILPKEITVGAAIDRQRRAFEQAEMSRVVVTVMGESIAGAEADEGGIR